MQILTDPWLCHSSNKLTLGIPQRAPSCSPSPSQSLHPMPLHCTCPLMVHLEQTSPEAKAHGLGLFSEGTPGSGLAWWVGRVRQMSNSVELGGGELSAQSEVYYIPLGSVRLDSSSTEALTSHPTSPPLSVLATLTSFLVTPTPQAPVCPRAFALIVPSPDLTWQGLYPSQA